MIKFKKTAMASEFFLNQGKINIYKNHFICFALMSSLFSISSVSRAESYTYQTLDNPYATGVANLLKGINNSGLVLGTSQSFTSDQQNILYNNFVYNIKTHVGNSITPPYGNGVTTDLYGINNNGDLVGYSHNLINENNRGVVYNGGTYSYIFSNNNSYAMGINDNGLVTGSEYIAGLGVNSSVYNLYNGSFTSVNVPSAITPYSTLAQGINNIGQVVGSYLTDNNYRGFLTSIQQTGDSYKASGIYTTLDVPHSDLTLAMGINNIGQVVGYFFDSTGKHGFVYNGSSYQTIDNPNGTGTSTSVLGINDSGQIVGSYLDSSAISHGFIATPVVVPVPTAIWLFISGLGLLAFNRRKNKNS